MSKKHQGIITKWQDDKGFGFIETSSKKSWFFHVSEFRVPRRPNVGDRVVFDVGQDDQGRWQAKQVEAIDVAQHQASRGHQRIRQQNKIRAGHLEFKRGQNNRLILGVAFYGVLILLMVMNKLAWWVVVWYLFIGVVTFLVYAKDKSAAKKQEWRTSESTLHLLSIAGGWVGALIAQTYLRHKSKKAEFQMVYFLTVVINLAGLLFLLVQLPAGQ